MKTLVLIDLHYTKGNLNSELKLQEVLRIPEDFEAIILGGDNAELSHGLENHRILFNALRNKFDCPIGFIIGNHELWGKKCDITSIELMHNTFPNIAREYELTYLEHSFREGKKVHKIRKFLGADLNKTLLDERVVKSRELINEEIEKYNLIKDPLQFKLSEKDILFVKKIENKIPVKISHLSEKQWVQFSELFTYNTNAIEGSELNSKEVKEILEDDKWPEEKSKNDIAEAYGVSEAINYIRETKEGLSLDLIKKIHEIVFKNSKSFAGQLRKPGEEVVVKNRLGEIVHEGAPQSRVIYLLNELINWYSKHKKTYPGLILAAVIHNQFENIHPFRDGNGRVGRILLNYILLKNKLPPINIDFKNRAEYYASLQAYQKKRDLRPTIDLFVKEYKALRDIFG